MMDVNTDFSKIENDRVGLVTPSYQSSTPLFSPSSSAASSPGIQGNAQRPLIFPSDSPPPVYSPDEKESLGGPLVFSPFDSPSPVDVAEAAADVDLAEAAADMDVAEAAALVLNFYSNPIIIAPDGAIRPVPDNKKKKKSKRKPLRFGSGGILKVCGTAGCTYSTKRGDHMRRHKMNMHSVGLKWHYCNIGECTYKCKRKEALTRHQASIHDETRWHECLFLGCNFKNRTKNFIKLHWKEAHQGNLVLEAPPPPSSTSALVGVNQR
ncbi:hypothetical protein TrCOL_g1618 [Triparma columacea]|uniref:C2H2-type domain-containing protein n=2 Tax=Triparma columacea TaxID=722753 RepID=A0A9W7GMI7_9STRA|nr:hypothetical protein TrCOL_g1618 [Triparma columacea]